MKDVALEDPPIEDLGPAMLALDARQRRFVVGWIQNRGKNGARVARAAGYSDKGEACKVRAHYLLQNPKIQKALHEEAGRRLDGMAAVAVSVLQLNMASANPKARQAAADSVLDRTGFARRTEQVVDIEDKREKRSYDQLLALVADKLQKHNLIAPPAPAAIPAPVVDAEFTEVKA